MQVNNQISAENISKKWLHAESTGSLFSSCSTCLLLTYQRASIELERENYTLHPGRFLEGTSFARGDNILLVRKF